MVEVRRNQEVLNLYRAAELEKYKGNKVLELTKLVGEVRLKFITDIPGQDMIYQRKEQEAKEYLALPEEPPTLVDYPFLEKEVGVTADTAYQLAQLWLNMSANLTYLGSNLEQIRLQAKKEISAATVIYEVDQLFDQYCLVLKGI